MTELDLLRGTLDMLVLKTLSRSGEALHGYAIAEDIRQTTEGVLDVEEGSLYPALHRLARRKWIRGRWGQSENNRRAKFYELTPRGLKQLEAELDRWERFTRAAGRVLGLEEGAARG